TLDVVGKFLRRAGDRIEAETREALLDLGKCVDPGNLLLQLLDDLCGRCRRRQRPDPKRNIVTGYAGLSKRGHVRKHRLGLAACDRERAKLSVLYVRGDRGQRIVKDRSLAGDDRYHRRSSSLEWDVSHLEPVGQSEQPLAGKMRR